MALINEQSSEDQIKALQNKVNAMEDNFVLPRRLAQGSSSRMDSDQVDGYNAFKTPTPNELLPLDSDGKIPSEALPSAGSNGFWIIDSVNVISPVSSTTITLPTNTNTVIRVSFFLKVSANSYIYTQYNSDTGTNYRYTMHGQRSDGTAINSVADTTDKIILTDLTEIVAASNAANGMFTIYHRRLNALTDHQFTGQSIWWDNAGAGARITSSTFGAQYTSSSDLSTLTVAPSAGTITGRIIVEKLVFA